MLWTDVHCYRKPIIRNDLPWRTERSFAGECERRPLQRAHNFCHVRFTVWCFFFRAYADGERLGQSSSERIGSRGPGRIFSVPRLQHHELDGAGDTRCFCWSLPGKYPYLPDSVDIEPCLCAGFVGDQPAYRPHQHERRRGCNEDG